MSNAGGNGGRLCFGIRGCSGLGSLEFLLEEAHIVVVRQE